MEEIIELLTEIAYLMTLKGEPIFRTRAFEKAGRILSSLSPDQAKFYLQEGEWSKLPGIGQSIAEVIRDYTQTGRSSLQQELISSLPPGLLDLIELPGLGPKKAKTLVEDAGICSLSSLKKACLEDRIAKLKGFGAKLQNSLLQAVSFKESFDGFKRLDVVDPLAREFIQGLVQVCPGISASWSGEYRRRREIIQQLEYFVAEETCSRDVVESFHQHFISNHKMMVPLLVRFVQSASFGYELARSTATPEHWKALGSPEPFLAKDEVSFYEKMHLPWIAPELRETGEEVLLARQNRLSELVELKKIRGVFHFHTNRSDGRSSLEEMVIAAENLGFEYVGVSDHSQSAFYAHGLKLSDLKSQFQEVQSVQKRHPHIRIFWGIESDILADGSLDYDQDTLNQFDFVIASIHSRLRMTSEEMTDRILKAIRHPSTRFLGHPTGRLLLERPAAEMDLEKIIQQAYQSQVAVETNAHPQRLDLDWRWGSTMRKYETLTSIHPDAHSTQGFNHMTYGVDVARKALLTSSQVLNTRSCREVEAWLKRSV